VTVPPSRSSPHNQSPLPIVDLITCMIYQPADHCRSLMADLTTDCRRSDRDHPAFALIAVDPIAAADDRFDYTHDLPNTRSLPIADDA
jgi:hypothetical protein